MSLNPQRLFFVTQLMQFIPSTSLFKLKRVMLRWAGATVGENVRICSSVKIFGTSELKLDDNVWIGHETMIICSSPISIGESVNIAPRVYIGTGTHQICQGGDSIAGEGYSMPISIGKGAWVCATAIIIAGSAIGEKSIVAAGAVVKGRFAPNCLIGGVPGKILKRFDV